MKTIWAILNKPKGRGSDRCWSAFRVMGKELCQADVEDLMIRLHYSTSEYFLSIGKDFIEDGCLFRLKEGKKTYIPWINYEKVYFEWIDEERSFIFANSNY